MPWKIAVGGVWHETNTFASGHTTFEEFHAYQFASGDEMLSRYRGVRNELGGMIAGAASTGLSLLPTLYAAAVPSATVSRDAYDQISRMLIDALCAHSHIDGVMLVLHGAMVSENVGDVEGALLQLVRGRIGRTRPLIATFDIHANLSPAMVQQADVLIGYDTYPHVDAYERGKEAVEIVRRLLGGGLQPSTAFEKLPLLSPPQTQCTDRSPMREAMIRLHEIEADPRVVTTSIAVGYPYADVDCAGTSVVVTTNSSPGLAAMYAHDLREFLWARRESFLIANVPVREAIQRAIKENVGPVILVDVADNIGGGAPGDGTLLLKGLLDARADGAVVTIADPGAVAEAIAAGIGNEVALSVGGKTDTYHGTPVDVRGRVRLISSGEYVHKGSYMTGQTTRMGRTVVLDCGPVELVLMERKAMPFDAQQLQSLGIDPADKKIIVVKSAIAWQAAYGNIAREVIYVDTPGICTSDLKSLPYERVPRPMFPLDPI